MSNYGCKDCINLIMLSKFAGYAFLLATYGYLTDETTNLIDSELLISLSIFWTSITLMLWSLYVDFSSLLTHYTPYKLPKSCPKDITICISFKVIFL